MRIWNISRSGTDIANNNRRRLTGSEPGLVSYYKFNEGSGILLKILILQEQLIEKMMQRFMELEQKEQMENRNCQISSYFNNR